MQRGLVPLCVSIDIYQSLAVSSLSWKMAPIIDIILLIYKIQSFFSVPACATFAHECTYRTHSPISFHSLPALFSTLAVHVTRSHIHVSVLYLQINRHVFLWVPKTGFFLLLKSTTLRRSKTLLLFVSYCYYFLVYCWYCLYYSGSFEMLPTEPVARVASTSESSTSRLGAALAAAAAEQQSSETVRGSQARIQEATPANVHPDRLAAMTATTSNDVSSLSSAAFDQQRYDSDSQSNSDSIGGSEHRWFIPSSYWPQQQQQSPSHRLAIGGGTSTSLQPASAQHYYHHSRPNRLASSYASALPILSESYNSSGSGSMGGLFLPTTGRSYYAVTSQTDDDEDSGKLHGSCEYTDGFIRSILLTKDYYDI
ncbi:hypothetical protein BDF19DRAFT_229794 [Syncephalis fuscata]|nr:hypothetical protein BDF19DRAFT_229794 [Syncephalis fuscata]